MWLLSVVCLAGTAFACQHSGKTYKDGEEWTERNAFKMQCKMDNKENWRVQVSACITPDGMEVPINSSKPTGQYEWECMMTPAGQVSLKQSIGKKADCGGGHPHGSEWTDKSFRFKCEEGGKTAFIGCVTKDGTIILDGQTKEVGGFDIECKKHANGTVTMGAAMRSDGSCRDSSGTTRQKDETWVESEHFVKTCKNGIPTVSGCKIPEIEDTIPLNGKVSKDNMEYHCEGSDGSYRFFSKVSA